MLLMMIVSGKGFSRYVWETVPIQALTPSFTIFYKYLFFPNSSFVGYDLSEEAIAYARNEAKELNLTNVKFEVKDLTYFNNEPFEKKFDFITTFDAVHDQARPDNLLSGIYKVLKDNGIYLMQDALCKWNSHAMHRRNRI